MPKRKDINKILIIGSGPIIIGQACEFDYSGTQALKALKSEGYRTILVNSNPATIMTDPQFADRTYIEPLDVATIEKIIAIERPEALLPTLGGQTALNLAIELYEEKVLENYGVELIGAGYESIKKAEDRELFKESMKMVGLEVPKSFYIQSESEGFAVAERVGFPLILRPSFTLGGSGGDIVWSREEYENKLRRAILTSPVRSVLIEESLIGWKEFELEVMRDKNDNFVVICPIENFDPMGIHTGDSITVAPSQTLTDREYQAMRDAAKRAIVEIGVDTGGSNIQFAVHPSNGRMMIIEMNPRVSRSSSLASKATGFPIARIAALLAVGYTLDEIQNFITRKTPASFEPSIDYVVVKIPRFDFEKFPGVDQVLTTQMKSIGEVMAIGRNFREALLKALRSIEKEPSTPFNVFPDATLESLYNLVKIPNPKRIFAIFELLRRGESSDAISQISKIDKWFIEQMKIIISVEDRIRKVGTGIFHQLREVKHNGFSDKYISAIIGIPEAEVREKRKQNNVRASFKSVDTCAAEFEAYTPYFYSTYDSYDEVETTNKRKVVILGAGPNRIGQGIEFDYCCVHSVLASKELGFETIMINSNPETVSTDYDISDRLYFEPITEEDVIEILYKEKPEGVIVSFGGQTPLKISKTLEREGFKILGTSTESIDIAEDRERFRKFLIKLGIKQPESKTAFTESEAKKIAKDIGYPVLVRPSYVLGGRAMNIITSENELSDFIREAIFESGEHPILIDKYLEDAVEVDVDLVSDGKDVYIGGILEHIEPAGIHSGDSANILPPLSLGDIIINDIIDISYNIARGLAIVGPMNIQMAVKDDDVFVLEVNPRASRTVPFISKATGVPLAKLATYVMLGKKLKEIGIRGYRKLNHFCVKEVVLPFSKLHGYIPFLGPEMRSTGEVMGISENVYEAYFKSQIASSNYIPQGGGKNVLITVRDKDKPKASLLAEELLKLGFEIWATEGTFEYFKSKGIKCRIVRKIGGEPPTTKDIISNKVVNLVINTVSFDSKSISDAKEIRSLVIFYNIPYLTTIEGASFFVESLKYMTKINYSYSVKPIQDYYKD